jgi:hypothetical protein
VGLLGMTGSRKRVTDAALLVDRAELSSWMAASLRGMIRLDRRASAVWRLAMRNSTNPDLAATITMRESADRPERS